MKSCVSQRESNTSHLLLVRFTHRILSFIPHRFMPPSRRGRRRSLRRRSHVSVPPHDPDDVTPPPSGSNQDGAALPDLASHMAPHLNAVMERLLQLSKEAGSETVRLAALREILDRTYGKPTPRAPVTENWDDSLADWSDEDLETLARRGAGGTPATGKRSL